MGAYCVYGHPSPSNPETNCVTAHPTKPASWCTSCLHREYVDLYNRRLDKRRMLRDRLSKLADDLDGRINRSSGVPDDPKLYLEFLEGVAVRTMLALRKLAEEI